MQSPCIGLQKESADSHPETSPLKDFAKLYTILLVPVEEALRC